MSYETFARACSLLSRMPSPTPWTEGMSELYAVGLRTVPDRLMLDVVTRAVMICPTRPSVAELMKIAADVITGPIPTAGEAFEEVARMLAAHGLYCRQDEENPNIFREGAPVFSHPLVEQTVRRMGGWRALCTGEADFTSLRSQFTALYEDMAERARIYERDRLAAVEMDDQLPAFEKMAQPVLRHLRLSAGA